MLPDDEARVIDDTALDSREVAPFRYSITSYGADYPIDGLVKRLREGDIFVPPFQRGYVWNTTDASRFVESLLLGLPVPGIFLSKEEKTQKLLVIDGQQRLKSLLFFYDGVFEPTERRFGLQGVQEQLLGVTYNSLPEEDRRRLDDSIIHATIVKQDVPSGDDSSIYYIFERLNTGGRLLRPQEIRACIYHGPFNDLLRELNTDQNWRAIFGAPSARLKDQELILRFLALHYQWNEYERPMKAFLNSFMGENRNFERYDSATLAREFIQTIGLARAALGAHAFKPEKALNAAVFDAVMVGLAVRLARGPVGQEAAISDRYDALLADDQFTSSYQRSTANEESVHRRIELAIRAFEPIL